MRTSGPRRKARKSFSNADGGPLCPAGKGRGVLSALVAIDYHPTRTESSRGHPMLVREILAIKGKVLYTIAPERSLAEAVAIMAEQDVGSLVVFAHGRMAGILTFREVLRAVNKGGAEWAATRIADAMVTD